MNRLMKNGLLLWVAILAAVILPGCVHEWPADPYPGEATLRLKLEHDRPIPLYATVDYIARSRDGVSSVHPVHHLRYIVNAYEAGSRTLISSRTFFKEEISSMDHQVEMKLPRGRYSVKVWAEYVYASTHSDLYYNPSDFSEIQLAGPEHRGCTDFRDAALGSIEADLTPRPGNEEWEDIEVSGVVRLERPLARFRFITTDINEFISRYEKETESNDGRAPSKSPADILSEYAVKLRYAGFMPSSFNVFTDAPADAATGIAFDGDMRVIDHDNIELGFDYVFVNHAETSVDVSVELYSRLTGALVASSDPIKVPLKRSHLTEVRGRFLTSTSTGGMGINPDFSGSFDIEIK